MEIILQNSNIFILLAILFGTFMACGYWCKCLRKSCWKLWALFSNESVYNQGKTKIMDSIMEISLTVCLSVNFLPTDEGSSEESSRRNSSTSPVMRYNFTTRTILTKRTILIIFVALVPTRPACVG